MNVFENIVTAFTLIHAGVVIGASVAIFSAYIRHRSMVHIAFVSVSYLLLTGLLAATIIGRIFMDAPTRNPAMVVAVIAFILGEIGLWKVWQSRNLNKGISAQVASQVLRNTHRIEILERLIVEKEGE